MKKLLMIGVVMLLLAACNQSEKPVTINSQDSQAAAEPDTLIATPDSVGTVKVLKQNIKYHSFSDPSTKDLFIVKLTGDSVQTATVTFEIKSSKGKPLHSETFPATSLLNYGVPENATEAQLDSFILNRIDTFFEEDNFKSPAITADMTFDASNSDKQIWDDIKSDETAVGFYYLIGEEDGRWIAYSKSQKKVVLYYNCC